MLPRHYANIFKTHAFGVAADIIANQIPNTSPDISWAVSMTTRPLTIDFIISLGPGQ
jgi:hypothetical protein